MIEYVYTSIFPQISIMNPKFRKLNLLLWNFHVKFLIIYKLKHNL